LIDRAKHIMSRIENVQELSNERKLLIDSYNIIEDLTEEVERLATHNDRLLQVIYQNQSELEN
jgi:predicted KAP-like P-loop ATPase